MAFPSERLERAFRVADSRHPLFDGTGAMLFGARWNSPGRRIVYAAETYSGALLEVLLHSSGTLPRRQAWIEIRIPADIRMESLEPDLLPGWDEPSFEASRAFGDRWYDENRSVILLVPSVVTRIERNILINQQHPDFARLEAGPPQPVYWDLRLWKRE